MARITGTDFADVLNGTPNNDIINGGLGADVMTGGLGHDTYFVDDAGDTIIEDLGEGTDWIHTLITYTLPVNVEHMRLIARTGDFNLTGNEQDNTLIGNRGNNILDGRGGTDTLIGGAGNDTYFINIFAPNGINWGRGVFGTDVIIDTAGIDTVTSNAVFADPTDITYILQPQLENATFTMANVNMTLTGNNKKNTLITGDGDDTIDGGRGADIMNGGDGVNVFFVDHKNDVIIDTFDDFVDLDNRDGHDIARISARNYTLDNAALIEELHAEGTRPVNITGNNSNNIIVGNSARNILNGGGGDDFIFGGGGRDILIGGAGADTFIFQSDLAFTGITTIRDFNPLEGDRIDISDIISYDDGFAAEVFVRITDQGRNSLLEVNVADTDSAPQFVRVAILQGINGLTGEQALIDAGVLIVQSA